MIQHFAQNWNKKNLRHFLWTYLLSITVLTLVISSHLCACVFFLIICMCQKFFISLSIWRHVSSNVCKINAYIILCLSLNMRYGRHISMYVRKQAKPIGYICKKYNFFLLIYFTLKNSKFNVHQILWYISAKIFISRNVKNLL